MIRLCSLGLLCASGALALSIASCSKLTQPPAPEPIASDTPVTMASASAPHTIQPAPSQQAAGAQGELKIEDIVMGKGPEVHNGDTVTIHYTGTLLDGTKFDSSHDHPGNQPLVSQIPGSLIQGWNRGIPGMKVGGKRKLTIPPSLGYGAQAKGKIPPNSTLLFDVELIDLKQGGGATPPPRQPRPNHP